MRRLFPPIEVVRRGLPAHIQALVVLPWSQPVDFLIQRTRVLPGMLVRVPSSALLIAVDGGQIAVQPALVESLLLDDD